MDIILYNSSNTGFQVFLATYGQFTAYDLKVLCPLSGFQTVLYEPTGIAYTSNLSTASNSTWVSGMSNLTQKIELATNTTTFSNTLAANVLQGSLNYTYLSNLPPLCSNTSPQVLYGSNTSYWSSNARANVATSANYVWASNAIRSNVNNATFSSNISVGLGITANSLAVNDVFVNNTINAQTGLSSGEDIVSSSAGGNNIGTSGSSWGGLNTLTASLGNATTTSLSNSGVISMNSGDGNNIVLTNVGTTAIKITHNSGWGVEYFAGSTTGTSGQHNYYTVTTGGWTNPMYINGTAINITNKLAVNQSVDSGVGRGIFWLNDGDANWTLYFASSGANRSSANGTACTSLDGRTAHHHRARAGNSATQGFLWENTSDQCVMSLTSDTSNLYVRLLVQTFNANVGQTLTAAILKGSLDYNYLSFVPSLGTSAQSTFASNAGAFGSNSGAFGSKSAVWSSNNCVKGSSLSNASYPIMITSTTPRLGLLWNGGTSGSLDFGFSTSAFQGFNGASARIKADDNNYSASLSFQSRTSGFDNSNMLTGMVIQSTGNVGINTTSPGCLLDVAGSARFEDTAITGLLTCSNGLAMKTNTWMTGTDNTNRMYFATSVDTTFSSPNGQYNFLNNTGATSVQITSNLRLNYPQSDHGFFCSSFYGTKPSLDIYGYGQFITGTVRAIISGSYSAASFRVCKPFNTSHTSWTDLLTVDSSGKTSSAGNLIATNI
jgi:hypothetical protein